MHVGVAEVGAGVQEWLPRRHRQRVGEAVAEVQARLRPRSAAESAVGRSSHLSLLRCHLFEGDLQHPTRSSSLAPWDAERASATMATSKCVATDMRQAEPSATRATASASGSPSRMAIKADESMITAVTRTRRRDPRRAESRNWVPQEAVPTDR